MIHHKLDTELINLPISPAKTPQTLATLNHFPVSADHSLSTSLGESGRQNAESKGKVQEPDSAELFATQVISHTFPSGKVCGASLNRIPAASLLSSSVPPLFDKLVWKVPDVMSFLDCSERHVRELVAEDRIPFSRSGRLLRFHKDRVVEWFLKGGTR